MLEGCHVLLPRPTADGLKSPPREGRPREGPQSPLLDPPPPHARTHQRMHLPRRVAVWCGPSQSRWIRVGDHGPLGGTLASLFSRCGQRQAPTTVLNACGLAPLGCPTMNGDTLRSSRPARACLRTDPADRPVRRCGLAVTPLGTYAELDAPRVRAVGAVGPSTHSLLSYAPAVGADRHRPQPLPPPPPVTPLRDDVTSPLPPPPPRL